MTLRYGELFAGAGGLSKGLERAGWECAFHAEVDPFARRILTERFPHIPLFDDVAELDGEAIIRQCGRIDLLSGGSPCQDLSLAGRRAGLIDGTRSNLFFEQMRLWKETGATYCLWENVVGALSSSKGEDFRYVLSAFVGTDIGRAVDRKGRKLNWAKSGVVCGPDGVAAWRVLDAQHWGVPQRRRRVFVLGARAGGVDPAEVLLEFEGVCWHPAPCGAPGEDVAGDAAAGARGAGADGSEVDAGHVASEPTTIISFYSTGGTHGVSAQEGTSPSLKVGSSVGVPSPPAVVSFYSQSNGEDLNRENLNVTPPLTVAGGGSTVAVASAQPNVIAFQERGRTDGRNLEYQENVAYALTSPHGGSRAQEKNIVVGTVEPTDPTVATFYAGNGAKAHGIGYTEDVCATLKGQPSGNNQVPTVVVFDTKQSGESHDGVAPTLRAMNYSGTWLNGGGQLGVVYAIQADATTRSGENYTPTADAAGLVRIRPPGLGVGDANGPMYTLNANGLQHAVFTASVAVPTTTTTTVAATSVSPRWNPPDRTTLRLCPICNNPHDPSPDGFYTQHCSGCDPDAEGFPRAGPVTDHLLFFDTIQVTNPDNRSVIEPDRPCPSISKNSRMHVARMQAFGQYAEDGTASAIKARDHKDATDIVYTVNNDSRAEANQNLAAPLRGDDRAQQTVYTVHGEHSTAMTGNGNASVAFPTEVTRTIDTNGGYASSQGGNIVQRVSGSRGNTRDGSFGFELDASGAFPVTFGIPRRLLPIECERLMSWPDRWTDVPDKGKPASDAARYRAIGNGVVSHCVEFIGARLLAAHEALLAEDAQELKAA